MAGNRSDDIDIAAWRVWEFFYGPVGFGLSI
jgi:hypothetical protein